MNRSLVARFSALINFKKFVYVACIKVNSRAQVQNISCFGNVMTHRCDIVKKESMDRLRFGHRGFI